MTLQDEYVAGFSLFYYHHARHEDHRPMVYGCKFGAGPHQVTLQDEYVESFTLFYYHRARNKDHRPMVYGCKFGAGLHLVTSRYVHNRERVTGDR